MEGNNSMFQIKRKKNELKITNKKMDEIAPEKPMIKSLSFNEDFFRFP